MTRDNVLLVRILGIPIGLDYSWFVIFVLLTWMLADNYYPAGFLGVTCRVFECAYHVLARIGSPAR